MSALAPVRRRRRRRRRATLPSAFTSTLRSCDLIEWYALTIAVGCLVALLWMALGPALDALTGLARALGA